MRRSSCCLGRMEIRSSSEDSQFTAFNAKSLLPLKPRNRFAAQDELPATTKRPCEFCLPVLYVPAAAIVSGPFLLRGSATLTSGELRLAVARLVPDESNSFSTLVLPPSLISRERERGKPTALPRICATIGCVL